MCRSCRILRSAMLNETPSGHCITIWITIYHDNFCQQRPDFSTALNGKLEYLASQNIEVVVMGDINIDLIKYNVHQFINDYLDDRKAKIVLYSQLSQLV